MSKSKVITTSVDVYLSDFDSCDLIDELECRGYHVLSSEHSLLQKIYEKRKLGHDYSKELDELLWETVGRM